MPLFAGTWLARLLSSVVLPEPLGPISASSLQGSTAQRSTNTTLRFRFNEPCDLMFQGRNIQLWPLGPSRQQHTTAPHLCWEVLIRLAVLLSSCGRHAPYKGCQHKSWYHTEAVQHCTASCGSAQLYRACGVSAASDGRTCMVLVSDVP